MICALRSRFPHYQEHWLPPMQGGCILWWAGPGYVRLYSGTLLLLPLCILLYLCEFYADNDSICGGGALWDYSFATIRLLHIISNMELPAHSCLALLSTFLTHRKQRPGWTRWRHKLLHTYIQDGLIFVFWPIFPYFLSWKQRVNVYSQRW